MSQMSMLPPSEHLILKDQNFYQRLQPKLFAFLQSEDEGHYEPAKSLRSQEDNLVRRSNTQFVEPKNSMRAKSQFKHGNNIELNIKLKNK